MFWDIKLGEKALLKKYIKGLKPDALKLEIEREFPDTVQSAKNIAVERIDSLRAARSKQ